MAKPHLTMWPVCPALTPYSRNRTVDPVRMISIHVREEISRLQIDPLLAGRSEQLPHMPMWDHASGSAPDTRRPPPHDGVRSHSGNRGYGFEAIEFFNDLVGWFASHALYVRYSYKGGKGQCVISLHAMLCGLCD